jgi:hypothetical protein
VKFSASSMSTIRQFMSFRMAATSLWRCVDVKLYNLWEEVVGIATSLVLTSEENQMVNMVNKRTGFVVHSTDEK